MIELLLLILGLVMLSATGWGLQALSSAYQQDSPSGSKLLWDTAVSQLPLFLVSGLTIAAGHSAQTMAMISGIPLASLFLILPLVAWSQPILVNKNISVKLLPFYLIVCVLVFIFSLGGEQSRWISLIELLIYLLFLKIMWGYVSDASEDKKPSARSLNVAKPSLSWLTLLVPGMGLGAVLSEFAITRLALDFHIAPEWLGLAPLSIVLALGLLPKLLRLAQAGQMAALLGQVLVQVLTVLLFVPGVLGLLKPFWFYGSTHPPQAYDFWALLVSGLLMLVLIGRQAPRKITRRKAVLMFLIYGLYLSFRYFN